MKCQSVQRRLECRFRDLSNTRLERGDDVIVAHLKSCPQCRRALSRLRGLNELMAEAITPPVPGGFASRVVARATAAQPAAEAPHPAPSPPERSAWRLLRPATNTAAALAVGLALGAFLGNDMWRGPMLPGQTSEAESADPRAGTGLGRLVVDYDDSLAQAYLELTTRRDG